MRKRTPMKLLSLLIVPLLILSLCGCNYTTVESNSKYAVICKEDRYYIRFHTTPPKSIIQMSILDATPEFSSFEEMRQAILTGEFSDSYYNQILYCHQEQKEIPICNLNPQYKPSLALGWWKNSVKWYETYYSYEITDGVHSGRFTYYETNESLYQRLHEDSLKMYRDNENVRIRSDRNRDATVYELPGYRTMVHYAISTQGKQLSIMEYYHFPNHYIEEFNPIPDGIVAYGTENGHFYELYINKLSRRPSVEWLQSFGLINNTYLAEEVNHDKN